MPFSSGSILCCLRFITSMGPHCCWLLPFPPHPVPPNPAPDAEAITLATLVYYTKMVVNANAILHLDNQLAHQHPRHHHGDVIPLAPQRPQGPPRLVEPAERLLFRLLALPGKAMISCGVCVVVVVSVW